MSVEQKLQRVQRTECIPQAIVNIEVATIGIVDGVIVTAEVAAVLSNIGHAAKRAIKSRVKDRALALVAAFDPDGAYCPVPRRAAGCLDAVKIPARDFSLKVATCLVNTYIGNANFDTNLLARSRFCFGREFKLVTL